MPWTAEEPWNLAWPDVPWNEASDTDKHMFQDHAESLALYHESKT